jgi:DNA-binding PadR family transcriptional regulator
MEERRIVLEDQILKKYSPMTETTYYTLLSVKEPRHGYAIMQFVSKLTGKRIQLGTGTLYTMLGRLVEDQLITIISNDNGRKVYQITAVGSNLIQLEIQRLRYQLDNGIQIFPAE